MAKRAIKALQALALVLLITMTCLAFMPWRISDAIDHLDESYKCMILRYDTGYSTAYPMDEELDELMTVLLDSVGHFDRKRSGLVSDSNAPLYRIYLWTPNGRIPDIWLCGSDFFYDDTQLVLNDDDAEALNAALASCFS